MAATRTYSVAEAAELFGVSTWTINRAIKRGELNALRFGRVTRIPRIEVERLLGAEDATLTPEAPPCTTAGSADSQ
jgi:excisionase family DNA binding protein